MSKRLHKHVELLKILKNSNPKQRKALLEAANNSLILCICECIHNLLRGNLRISSAKKQQLKKHTNILREIADRKTKVDKKRALLVQNGGFLPALLAPVLTVAGGLIGDLIGNLVRK